MDRPEPVYASVAKSDNETDLNDGVEYAASPEMVELFQQRETLSSHELLPIVTSASCGIIFGIAFNKSRIFEPFLIIDQMLFTRFVMLKLFLSAKATSCFIGVIASHFYPEQYFIARSKFNSLNHAFPIALGSLILGAGMSISGSCQGSVLVQIGSGVPNSGFVLIGVLSGALFYGLTEPLWAWLCINSNTVFMKHIFTDDLLNKRYKIQISGKVIGIVCGVIFWGTVIVFEVFWPWHSELNTPNEPNCNFLSCGSWPPEICGFMVGLTQLALISILGNSLGASSIYICLMAQWLRLTKNASIHDRFQQFKDELNRWWQVVFAFSVVFGSWLGVALNSNQSNLNVVTHPYDGVKGVGRIRALVGGFVLMVGSRIAKGCPSGHGLSGFMLMTIASMIAVPCIFIGAIATAFIMQAYGL
eukprot:200395_1